MKTLFFVFLTVCTVLSCGWPVLIYSVLLSQVWIVLILWKVFGGVAVGIHRFTLLGMLLSLIIYKFLRNKKIGLSFDIGFVFTFILLLLMLATSLYGNVNSELAFKKALLFLLYNVCVYAMARALFYDYEQVHAFCTLFFYVGLSMAIFFIYLYVTESGVMTNRFLLSEELANPIEIARFFGISMIVTVYLICRTQSIKTRTFLFSGLIIFAFACVLNGSRGPAFSACLLCMLYYWYESREVALEHGSNISGLLRMPLQVGSAVFIIFFVLFLLPEEIMSRITMVSDQSRMMLWSLSIKKAWEFPFGVGTAAFGELVSRGQSGSDIYPHNLILEFIVENGWIAGIAVLSFIIIVMSRIHRAPKTVRKEIRFAGYLFYFALLCSQFSGNIITNNAVWSFAGMVMGVYGRGRDESRKDLV
jgi:hypothetical protein